MLFLLKCCSSALEFGEILLIQHYPVDTGPSQGNFSPLSQAVPDCRHLKTFMAMDTDCKNNNNNAHLSHQQLHIRKGEAVGPVSRASSQLNPHDWTREVPWVSIWERCWNEEAQKVQRVERWLLAQIEALRPAVRCRQSQREAGSCFDAKREH